MTATPPEWWSVTYLLALGLTLGVEGPIVGLALRRWYCVPIWRGCLLAAVASLLTHPLVWFVLPPLVAPTLGYGGYLLAAEIFAWLAEAYLYIVVVRRDVVGMLLVSLVANLASFSLGVLGDLSGLLHLAT